MACDMNTALGQVAQAQHLSANLLVQFTRASDAASKAVMAESDEASVAFAREAEEATQAALADIAALQPVLKQLGDSEDLRLLQEFEACFSEYRELDRRILDLAVENSNLKAQRLSFGPAREAADAFRDALTTLAPREASSAWQVKALVATALLTVREIQVLQAPHIADADEKVMAQMEGRMASSEADARSSLAALAALVRQDSAPQLATATAALDRFMAVNAQITDLSRRNTNVRSLALSLNQKATVTRTCGSRLQALRDHLVKEGFTSRR
jgi:hypothetical protein